MALLCAAYSILEALLKNPTPSPPVLSGEQLSNDYAFSSHPAGSCAFFLQETPTLPVRDIRADVASINTSNQPHKAIFSAELKEKHAVYAVNAHDSTYEFDKFPSLAPGRHLQGVQ